MVINPLLKFVAKGLFPGSFLEGTLTQAPSYLSFVPKFFIFQLQNFFFFKTPNFPRF